MNFTNSDRPRENSNRSQDAKPKGKVRNYLDFGFGSIFMGYVAYTWASAIIKEMGYVGYRGRGLFIGFGIFLLLLLCVITIDLIMIRLDIQRIIRSAVWLSIVIGPYVGIVVFNEWGSPVWGHLAGAISGLVIFVFSWWIDQRRK